MRVRLEKNSLIIFFNIINQLNNNWHNTSKGVGVCSRTLREWRNGQATIPNDKFKKLCNINRIDLSNIKFEFLPEYWNVKNAAKKGAMARNKIYGNPGTKQGRILGGKNSIVSHSYLKTNFVKAKEIIAPLKSSQLAELMGILIGDGHISKYQISVTTNSKTDFQHAEYTANLFYKLFKLKPVIKKLFGENTVIVLASSCRLSTILQNLGMPLGNKIKSGLHVPLWIKNNNSYLKAFIRGVFDTDGCIYIDTHKNKKTIYRHFGLTITSYSPTLIKDILESLNKLGFSPTNRKTQKSIYIRRQEQIEKFFKLIGSSNQKHWKRFKRGRVPKWS